MEEEEEDRKLRLKNVINIVTRLGVQDFEEFMKDLMALRDKHGLTSEDLLTSVNLILLLE
jgi:phosphotransacetylase